MIQKNITDEHIEKKEFEIIPKNDPIKSLIQNYKSHISITQLKDEIYKWELVNQYRGRPNPETTDFYQEVKDVKFQNLIYAMGVAVLHHLAKSKPEELKDLFINLFDENKDLTERVKTFNKDTFKIYRELGETLQHHQDERSIATYLTFHDSNKYTFYKSSYYKKYCKLLGLKEAKKNEKYIHYLTLIDELIEEYIVPDTELIEQVKILIPQFYDGRNHKLLAQDILYQMLDKKTEINYWVFQGNPKVFDFETALKQDFLTDWTVSAHKDKIKVGDKVILWITGKHSGCYALAEVTTEPHIKASSPDDHLWKGEDKSELKADIKITHNLVDSPILKEYIDSQDELKNLKVGNQGTNFNASEKEYQTFLNLIKTENTIKSEPMNFPLNTILYGPPGTGKTYNTVLRAAQIIENRAIDTYNEALNIFKANLHDQIEFITFHQNYSYEDFIQGLRPDTENEKDLIFERKDGVFKIIADKAITNLLELEDKKTAKLGFEEVYKSIFSELIEGSINEFEIRMKKASFFITNISEKSIEFRKQTGDSNHTLSLKTLSKMYDIGYNNIISGGLQPYYDPLLGLLLTKGEIKKGKTEKKNYVIIIDEINRANISRVFGELITLIEPDKRSHGKIPLEARLPSGDLFVVPSNLYIIGTMNTADKSIALLDIALRRRFEFESMYPLYEINEQEIYDVEILKKINEQIIKSKGHDFQIGHAYFMGDNKNLIERMNKKVIPLLLEYYMNDKKEVEGILKSAGLIIVENSWPLKISGKND